MPFVYEGKEVIHKKIQYEVSVTVCMGRIANKRKVPKWLPFKKLQVRIIKYLMCIYRGHRCIWVPNMKLLCLILWLGEVCTDDDTNADNDDARWTKHDWLLWLIKHGFQDLLGKTIKV